MFSVKYYRVQTKQNLYHWKNVLVYISFMEYVYRMPSRQQIQKQFFNSD